MKKYLVYGEKADGSVECFECFAVSKEEAKNEVISVQGDIVRAEAFDWDIQFRR